MSSRQFQLSVCDWEVCCYSAAPSHETQSQQHAQCSGLPPDRPMSQEQPPVVPPEGVPLDPPEPPAVPEHSPFKFHLPMSDKKHHVTTETYAPLPPKLSPIPRGKQAQESVGAVVGIGLSSTRLFCLGSITIAAERVRLAVWFERVLQQQVDYLMAENKSLKEKLGDRRLQLIDSDRRRLAILGRK